MSHFVVVRDSARKEVFERVQWSSYIIVIDGVIILSMIICCLVPMFEVAEDFLFSVQGLCFSSPLPIAMNIRKESWIIDGDQGQVNKVIERVVLA